MSKSDPVLDKLIEISERLAVVETSVGFMQVDMAEVKHQDQIQNSLLAEHIAGVETARQMIALEKQTRQEKFTELDERLTAVEAPKKAIMGAKTVLLWVGGIAGAVVSIAKFVGLF